MRFNFYSDHFCCTDIKPKALHQGKPMIWCWACMLVVLNARNTWSFINDSFMSLKPMSRYDVKM